MPLPWKKGKKNGSRISRIVADLHSPTRGNSLVVETGFPTSLVDLFVKNRDRLKKKSQKKTRNKKSQLQQEEQQVLGQDQELETLVISDPVRLTSYRDAGSSTGEEDTSGNGIGDKLTCDKGFDDCLILGSEDSSKGVRTRINVLVLVWRVFVVAVVLGLSTKKMVIGLTLSAVVLIFLECSGRRFSCLCLLVRDCLSLIRGGLALLPPRFGLVVGREEVGGGGVGVDGSDGNGVFEFDSRVEEIEVVDSGFGVIGGVEEDRGKGMITLDLVDCDERFGEVGILGVEGERNGVEEYCSRSARIRRKIVKKLVPKKFRRGKKGKMSKDKKEDLGDEAFDCLGGEGLGKIEEAEVPGRWGKPDFKNKGKLSLSQLLIEEDKEEIDEEDEKRNKDVEGDHIVSGSSQELQAERGMVVDEPRVGNEREGNSGYIILFLIVLAGLVGGRILAFLLTVSSCVMLKLVGRWRRIS